MSSFFRSLSSFTAKEIEQFFRSVTFTQKSADLKFMFAPAQKATGRILLVVPKYFGNAPKRNKLKRRLKSVFILNKLFEHKFDLSIKPVKPNNLSYAEIEAQIQAVYAKLLANKP
jgi:ribonuclease P protein component